MTAPTLTEFLSARLDDDEAAAREAHQDVPTSEPDFTVTGWPSSEHPGRVVIVGVERFLADIAATRLIIELRYSAQLQAERFVSRPGDVFGAVFKSQVIAYDSVLRARATIYEGHPDYRQEWT